MVQSHSLSRPILMGRSQLRGVAGCHSQYMVNMGSMASLDFALATRSVDPATGVQTTKLWGLCVNHHSSKRFVPYVVRNAGEFIAQARRVTTAQQHNSATAQQHSAAVSFQHDSTTAQQQQHTLSTTAQRSNSTEAQQTAQQPHDGDASRDRTRAQVFTLQLTNMLELQRRTALDTAASTQAMLCDRMMRATGGVSEMLSALAASKPGLPELVNAHGAAIVYQNTIIRIGTVPPEARAQSSRRRSPRGHTANTTLARARPPSRFHSPRALTTLPRPPR